MPIVDCKICQKSFDKSSFKVKRDKNHYCCRECFNFGKNKMIKVKCQNCGAETKKAQDKIETRNNYFCNMNCYRSFYANEFKIFGEYTILYLHSKKYGDKEVFIDTEDLERVRKATWVLDFKNKSNLFYLRATINVKKFYLHRFIMNYSGSLVVDHISGDTLDNRKSNLRLLGRAENGWRTKST